MGLRGVDRNREAPGKVFKVDVGSGQVYANYILLEETNNDKHWVETEKRAISFEERNKKRPDKVCGNV